MLHEDVPNSPDTTKIDDDNKCGKNINEKSVSESFSDSTEQVKDNNDTKPSFRIVKTIPNNSTPESNPMIFETKISEYEDLFTNRYTDESVEFVYESNKGIIDPFISYNYGKRRFDHGNKNRPHYNNNRNNNYGRRNNDGHRYENNGRRYDNGRDNRYNQR
uniref:Btz domain-containing protein n=1 Tax=Strongyloides venezuelensis TaxID=75913 RepID=A0A0K0FKD1_STRVS